MALVWRRVGLNSVGEDAETKLTLLVDRDGAGFDFNGHKFATEAEARAYAEEYAAEAIVRKGLKPKVERQ